MTPDEIDKAKGKALDKIEQEAAKSLRLLQRSLTEILMLRLSRFWNLDSGTVERSVRNLNITKEVEAAFKTIEKDHQKVIAEIAKGITGVSGLNKDYFTPFTTANRLARVSDKAANETLRFMGLRKKGRGYKIIKDGFFDLVLGDNRSKQRIKQMAINAVSGNAGLEDTMRAVRDTVTGGKGKTGMFERYYRTYVYDTVQQSERIEADLYATELGLSAFIYSGTVIGTTRDFCKSRAGEVFTRREARKWKKLKWSGKPKNYVPTRDAGGWNCRHRIRWISNEEAARRRDDLEVIDGKLVKKNS